MKDIIDQINDLIAPVTRAYSDPEIVSLEVDGKDIHEDYALVTLHVKVKRDGKEAI